MSIWNKIITSELGVCRVIIENPLWWREEAPGRTEEMINLIKDELNHYAPMPVIVPPQEYHENDFWVHEYKILANSSIYNDFTSFIKRRIPNEAKSSRGYGTSGLILRSESGESVPSNLSNVYFFTKRDDVLHLYRA